MNRKNTIKLIKIMFWVMIGVIVLSVLICTFLVVLLVPFATLA